MNLQSIAAQIVACLADGGERHSLVELAATIGCSVEDAEAACALLLSWDLLDGAGQGGVRLRNGARRLDSPFILVVENTPAVAHVLNALLDSEGYRVLLAETLATGIAVLNVLTPDLVISDSFAPSPGEALARVQPLRRVAAPAPVLLFTAYRDIGDDSARAAGFAGVLPKPFDIDELLARVASASHWRQALLD